MKVYFQTHGCSTNQAEEEVMAGLLNREGYEKVDKKEDADIVVLNMCSVKGIQVAKKQLSEIKGEIDKNIEERKADGKEKQKLIVSGCIPRKEINELKEISPEASFCHTDNMMEIQEVAKQTIEGNVIEKMEVNKKTKIGFPRIRRNNLISIIPINEGCNDACTYCSTKLIKGSTQSYPMRLILKEIEDALESGCKEIQLTSQDTGAYGWDEVGKSLLPELVKSILSLNKEEDKKEKYEFKIRIGMLNPMNIYEQFDEVIEAMDDERVYKFLHLPLQAGSNKVLKSMKRKYTKEEFNEICDKFYKKFSKGTIATDIIVGFPGETEQDFEETLENIRRNKFDVVNISRYVDRPGTISHRMDNKVHGRISKERSEKVTKLFEEIAKKNKENLVGEEFEILINDKKEDLIGRTNNYNVVVVKQNEMSNEDYNLLLGKKIKVKIKESSTHHLFGELKQSNQQTSKEVKSVERRDWYHVEEEQE